MRARVDSAECGLLARSQKEAMEWSLALVSQGIESTLARDDTAGWVLWLPSERRAEAEAVIRAYVRENRKWNWRRPFRSSTRLFHWGAAGWCLLLAFLDLWSRAGGDRVREAGLMRSMDVWAGEWWRLFTATTMHADLAHWTANAGFGFLLLGLAMAHWGAGAALLATWCAGGLGNVAGLLLHAPEHQGLGASGMVMGALGLLAASPWHRGKGEPFPTRDVIRGIVGGVLLFVLLGLAPASDTVAHVGGFLGGMLLGFGLAQVPGSILHGWRFSLGCGVATATWLVWVWALALRG